MTPYVSSVAAPAVSSSSEKVSLIRHESSSNSSAVLNAVRQSLSADRPSSAGMMSLQRELEFSKAELEREQAQRKLDRQKSDQEVARLRRQMEFLLEELEGHKAESDKIRAQAEKDVKSLKRRLEDTIGSLKSLEDDYMVLQSKHTHNQPTVEALNGQLWNDRCKGYEDELEKLREAFIHSEQRAVDAERKLFQHEQTLALAAQKDADSDADSDYVKEKESSITPEGKAALASMINARQQLNREPVTADDYMDEYLSASKRKRRKVLSDVCSSPSSPAPTAVMRELTKTRLALADSERSNRSLTRKYEEAKNKLQELNQVDERFQRSQERTSFLESQYSSVLKKLMTMEEVEKEWKHFRKELLFTLPSEQTVIFSDAKRDIASTAPPEISAVVRKFQGLHKEVKDKADECESYRAQLESSNRRLSALQTKIDALASLELQMEQLKKSETKKLDFLQMEVDRAKASERIAKAEAKSMKQLLDTYELREASEVKEGTMKILGVGAGEAKIVGPGVAALTTSLFSAQQEIDMLKETHKNVCKQLQDLQVSFDEKMAEHKTVLEKFSKLRSSLMDEREKAKKAEDRAIHAETLAGKGSYNQDITRVLHLKENPFIKAVRDKYESQIAVLQGEIEHWKKGSEGSSPSTGSATLATTPATSSSNMEGLEAKKYNQRLKDQFQEHIGVFREAVYLLTGYKVDMIMDSDSSRFKVRSIYAEREEDHLMFLWPKLDRGVKELKPTRLDLLDTELAKSLSATSTFEYLSKYDSLPAFSAALTLSLFENTTITG